jgi:AcrR family transcriptional regulator
MFDSARSRDGRVLGKAGAATREKILDALAVRVEKHAWRSISAIHVARDAGVSPSLFYILWPALEDATVEMAWRKAEANVPLSPRIEAILALLGIEGWKVPMSPLPAEPEVQRDGEQAVVHV